MADEKKESIFKKPGFWILVVVIIAGLVTLALYLKKRKAKAKQEAQTPPAGGSGGGAGGAAAGTADAAAASFPVNSAVGSYAATNLGVPLSSFTGAVANPTIMTMPLPTTGPVTVGSPGTIPASAPPIVNPVIPPASAPFITSDTVIVPGTKGILNIVDPNMQNMKNVAILKEKQISDPGILQQTAGGSHTGPGPVATGFVAYNGAGPVGQNIRY